MNGQILNAVRELSGIHKRCSREMKKAVGSIALDDDPPPRDGVLRKQRNPGHWTSSPDSERRCASIRPRLLTPRPFIVPAARVTEKRQGLRELSFTNLADTPPGIVPSSPNGHSAECRQCRQNVCRFGSGSCRAW